MCNSADSNSSNTGSPNSPPREWTKKEMESAEPMPLPEIPDDEEEANGLTIDDGIKGDHAS